MTRSPLDWILVGALAVLSGVVAVFGVFFLPSYSGSVPLPLVIIPVGLTVAILPRLAYRLTGRMLAAALPVLAWFVVTIWLFLSHNALYINAPVAWQSGWQFNTMLGVGVLAAAASVGLLWGDHMRAAIDQRAIIRSGADETNSHSVTSDSVHRPPGDGGY
jgi:hypothetical protein